jgi:tetratricopeptide (TPR) repeat protein
MNVRKAILLPLLMLATGVAMPATGHAQDAAQLIAQGDSLLAIDRPQKAVDKFTQAIEKDGSATSFAARARAWYKLDRMDRFLLDTEKALNLDSTHAEANYHKSVYAFRSEDYRNAERSATRSIGKATSALRQDALVIRGQARVELKKSPEAIADLKEGLGDRTENFAAMKSLARALDATGDHAGSLAVLEKLCTVEPYDIGNWTNRGFELASLGQYENALIIYEEALSIDKDEPTVLSNRANALLQLGRTDEAMQDVSRSLRSYPSNAFALRTRGILLARKGEKEKACADFQLARILGGVPDVDKLIEEYCGGIQPKR